MRPTLDVQMAYSPSVSDRPVDSTSVERRTLTDQLEEAIRRDILFGHLPAGTTIRARELTLRYGVSATPLREAVQRLAAEGLVELLPRRGIQVARLSLEDVRDVYGARKLIETAMLKEAVRSTNPEWLANVERAYLALMAVGEPFTTVSGEPRSTPADRLLLWRHLHRAFHAALVAPCRSVWLHRIRDLLVDHSERYVIASTVPLAGQRRTTAEHSALFEAVRKGDPDVAAQVLADHLDRTLASIVLLTEGDPAGKDRARAAGIDGVTGGVAHAP